MKTIHRVAWTLFAVTAFAAPRPATAQFFVSGHGALSFVGDGRPSFLVGADMEATRHHCPLPNGTGPVECQAAAWWFSLSPYVGITFSHAVRAPRPRGTASLDFGIIHRVCDTQALGLLAVASAWPDGIGVAVRYEPVTLVGIEYGVLRLRSHENGVYVRVDVSTRLLGDRTRGWTKHRSG